MAAFFGSMMKMPVKTPGGDIGYTSKRRREALEGAGYTLDNNGFVVQPQAQGPQMGMPAGGGGMMAPFQQLLPMLLASQMFARPEARNMLGSMFGAPQPQAPQPGMMYAGGSPNQGLAGPGSMFPGMATMPGMSLGNKFDFSRFMGGGPATPGPAPSPFAGLGRYQGVFGNGGAGMLPGHLQRGRMF